jgi:hypothetical protein
LFDPLSVPDELRERATAVVLTAPYHEHCARRLALPVHTPPADTLAAVRSSDRHRRLALRVRRLRPPLDLPVERVLPAHGEPTDRAALERVLS